MDGTRGCATLLAILATACAQSAGSPHAWSATFVGDWIEQIGFPEYAAVFRDAQIDGEALLQLAGEAMEKEPLLIASAEHRLVIEMELAELKLNHGLLSSKEAKAHEQAHPSADAWSTRDVKSFLTQNGLSQYTQRFAQVDGRALLGFSIDHLRQLLDVPSNPNETNEATLELMSALVMQLRKRGEMRRQSRSRDEL